MASFADLGVPAPILDALASQGITDAFEIQAATIGDLLAGHDLCGRAPTGSGKTLAFGLPLLANLLDAPAPKPYRPLALILVPTRELAEQIVRDLDALSDDVRWASVYGGVGYGNQLRALKQGVHGIVACPGRLEDLIERGDCDLSGVTQVVLDEADRMADMGFLPCVHRILDQTNPDRQTVLFSATLDGDVAEVRRRHQNDPKVHEVGPATPDIRSAQHMFFKTEKDERNPRTAEVIKAAWPTVVFVRTRHGADRLAKQLNNMDLKTVSIHGDMSQNKRQRALDEFAAHQAHALIATDVAARGIHVDGVRSVVHYDLPQDDKDYVHRSGRTARAGEQGSVIAFVPRDQLKKAQRLIKTLELDTAIEQYADADLDEVRAEPPTPKPIPKAKLVERAERAERNGRNGRAGGGGRGGRNGGGGRNAGRGDGRSAGGRSRNDRDDRGPRRDDRRNDHGPRRDDRFARDGRPADSRGDDRRNDRGPRRDDQRTDGYRNDRYRGDRATNDRPRSDRYDGNRNGGGRYGNDRSSDRSTSRSNDGGGNRRAGGRSGDSTRETRSGGWDRGDRPRGDRPRGDRPQGGRDDRGRNQREYGQGRTDNRGDNRPARAAKAGPNQSASHRSNPSGGERTSRLNRKARRAHLQPDFQGSKSDDAS